MISIIVCIRLGFNISSVYREIMFLFSGETEENRLHNFQGQTDTTLNDLGHQQARLAAEKLSCETFTSIYSSDLKRAKEVVNIPYLL